MELCGPDSDFHTLALRALRDELGFDDVLPYVQSNPHVRIRNVGGGTIVTHAAADRTWGTELHIVPHAGTEIPTELTAAAGRDELRGLALHVAKNVDGGTATVAAMLIDRVIRDPGAVLAYFRVSRVLLDANRRRPSDQIVRDPYMGDSLLPDGYIDRRATALRRALVEPWVEAVRRVILDRRVRTVFHHHSFDVRSQGKHVNDACPGSLRPPGQTFLARARTGKENLAGDDPATDMTLSPAAVIAEATSILGRTLGGVADGSVTVDDPLRLPLVPFPACADDDPAPAPWNVAYEIRRDLFRSGTKGPILSGIAEMCERVRHLAADAGPISSTGDTAM